VRFTVQYPIHPAPAYAVHGYDPALLEPASIARFAVAAERLGFDAIAFTEHPAPSQKGIDNGGHDNFDPPTVLAFCAAVTTRLRLIPYATVLPYRNPFLVAKQLATLDRVSGGRAVLAAAVGYLRSEFAALGVNFEERNELFDESVALIRRAWKERGIAHEGRHFHALAQTQLPMPAREIPIWIAGNAAHARQRAAEYGAGWAPVQYQPWQAKTTRTVPLETVADLAAAIVDLRERTERAGRDPAALEIQVESGASGALLAHTPLAEHRAHVEELAHIGVTQFVVDTTPTHGVDNAIAELEHYAEVVLAPLSDARTRA
jgi:probable F420-dependent oxidoreductase